MSQRDSHATIISMAVIASAVATLLHEGLGHGVVAWLRGDVPTEITSNHLSSLHRDRWVDAGGTLVNLLVGSICLGLSTQPHRGPNTRYFLWLLAALNLLPGAGYFVYSGIFGIGDWQEVIRGLPHQAAIRVAITIFGAALYFAVTSHLAAALKPFRPDQPTYNTVGRLPYFAAGLFSCAAGLLDPLGMKLMLTATVAAAFGGSSGLLWAYTLLPTKSTEPTMQISPQPAWWIVAAIIGLSYIFVIGRGVQLSQ